MSQKAYLVFLINFYERVLQITGLWPITIDRNNYSLHRSNVRVVYSICVLFLVLMAFIGASFSFAFVWPTDNTLISEDIRNLYLFALITIFLAMVVAQYTRLQDLTDLHDCAFRVLRKIQQTKLKSVQRYRKFLLVFTVKTLVLFLADSYSLVKHLIVLSPSDVNIAIPIGFWLIYSWIFALLPDVIFGLWLILSYHFRILNQSMSEIVSDANSILLTTSRRPNGDRSYEKHQNGIHMQMCCDLSDRLDEIAVLHQDLSALTVLANRSVSVQLLIWTAWSVMVIVVKLFLEYFLVAAALSGDMMQMNLQLFFGLLLSVLTTLLNVSCLATASAQTMCEVYLVAFVMRCNPSVLFLICLRRLNRRPKYYTRYSFIVTLMCALDKV